MHDVKFIELSNKHWPVNSKLNSTGIIFPYTQRTPSKKTWVKEFVAGFIFGLICSIPIIYLIAKCFL